MRLGPYEIGAKLGQGGMGVVFSARSPDGREVAVKLLRKTVPEAVARFERERRLLASLGEAEGFVPLVDAGTSEQGPYLVMALVPGGTLRRKLEAGRPAIEETVAIGQRLAFALGAAHARGIVHRDVKPENVLFTEAGLPLIADLGLAKHFDFASPGASQSVSLSQGGILRGTSGYMAPEQMRDARSVGPPADVFALGVVLYESLAGEPPFVAATLIDLIGKVMAGTFVPIRERRAEVPEWLAAVVARALAPEARHRFPDGLALGRALAARGRGASPGPRRFRWALAAAAGLLGLAGALGLAASLKAEKRPEVVAPPPRPPRPPAPPEAVVTKPVEAGRRPGGHDWDAEIAEGTRLLALDPNVAVNWETRGVARGNKGDFEGMLADETRAIELDPSFARAWSDRAGARGNLRDWAGAIADDTRAIELDPTLAFAWTGRAIARAHRGEWDAVIADATRAIELDPTVALAFTTRASARGQKGDDPGVIADCTRAIALEPALTIAWINRATARRNRGENDGAIADCTRAIDLDPRIEQAWYVRSKARFARGDLTEATDDLTRAIELDPRDARCWLDRAGARAALGERRGAIADYEHWLELAPSDPNAAGIRAGIERLRAREKK
jgi:tetratricopeptide (TPR) repeat protein